jgi:hypothetical protein
MGFNIKKTSDIVIKITLQENSWNNVNEINVVFGKAILIIGNSSYKEGFNNGREESTTITEIKKHPNVNPCVICDDVYNTLLNTTFDIEDNIEAFMKRIEHIIKECNIE